MNKLFNLLWAGFLFSTSINATDEPKLKIYLDAEKPQLSYGLLKEETFPVGLGRHGILAEGEVFKGGYSLLGTFRINAILSNERFEMDSTLIEKSGKTADWLSEHLFSNMSSIDFDGDDKGGEYGSAFISLEPVSSKAAQPFRFNTYKGVFRWYSFAIHGTQDETRIGKCATGGCINVKQEHLEHILKTLKLGDLVVISKHVNDLKSSHSND